MAPSGRQWQLIDDVRTREVTVQGTEAGYNECLSLCSPLSIYSMDWKCILVKEQPVYWDSLSAEVDNFWDVPNSSDLVR